MTTLSDNQEALRYVTLSEQVPTEYWSNVTSQIM